MTAEVRHVRKAEGRRRLCEGKEKGRMGCFLDYLRAFGINADQWTTAARDEGEWRTTAEKGRNVSWRNGSLERKLGLDYAM